MWERFGVPINMPNKLKEMEFDYLIITSAPGLESFKMQCAEFGISDEKIIMSYIEDPLESRRIFLKTLASMPEIKELNGACAEAGGFEGDFAKYINEFFSNRILYLFDTFEGFDERDILQEGDFSEAIPEEYGNTSVQKVVGKRLIHSSV